MIKTVRYRSIREIDPVTWNALDGTHSFFKSHEFLLRVEESGIENCIYWYLLFHAGEEVVGACVLSSFSILMDLFLGPSGKKMVRAVRRLFPSFLRFGFLFCGIPVSVGKDTILIKDKNFRDGIIESLVKEMKIIAKELTIPILCLKEFFLDDESNPGQCKESGFVQLWSIPYMAMDVPWSTFNDYLMEMRYGYRRPLVKHLKKVDFSRLGIRNPHLESDHATLHFGEDQPCTAAVFFEQYLQVMGKATVILEVLTRPFFEKILSFPREKVDLLTLAKGEKILGSAILVKEEKKLTFLLVGFDYAYRDKYWVYFNLIYGIVAYAIKFGFKKIDLGQTSYSIKQKVGGKGRPMVIYLHSPKKFLNFLLRVLNRWISPEIRLETHHVFKQLS